MLEHHAHLLTVQGQIHLFAGDVHAVEDDRAGRGLFQQVQASQECTLAAAGRPDDGHHVALADVRGHAVQRLDIAAVVVFFQVMHLYECLCHQICTSRCCLCLRSLPLCRSARFSFRSKWPNTLLRINVIRK